LAQHAAVDRWSTISSNCLCDAFAELLGRPTAVFIFQCFWLVDWAVDCSCPSFQPCTSVHMRSTGRSTALQLPLLFQWV